MDNIEASLASLLFNTLDPERITHWLWSVLCANDEKLQERAAGSASLACGEQFRDGDVAYSCEDCQIDNLCVQCVTCFEQANHKGHHFQLIQVGAGGCCDCGDPEAWKPSGNCPRHSPDAHSQAEFELAPHTLSVLEKLVPLVLKFLALALSNRENISPYPDELVQSKPTHATLLFNDDTHSFAQVIRVLREAVPHSTKAHALSFATRIDHLQQCIVRIGTEQECALARTKLASIGLGCEVVALSMSPPGWRFISESTVIDLFKWLVQVSRCHPALCRSLGNFTLAVPQGLTSSLLNEFLNAHQAQNEPVKEALQDWWFSMMTDPNFKRKFAQNFIARYPALVSSLLRGVITRHSSIMSLAVQLFTLPSLTLKLVRKDGTPFVLRLTERALQRCCT
jgi:hypothetical protein